MPIFTVQPVFESERLLRVEALNALEAASLYMLKAPCLKKLIVGSDTSADFTIVEPESLFATYPEMKAYIDASLCDEAPVDEALEREFTENSENPVMGSVFDHIKRRFIITVVGGVILLLTMILRTWMMDELALILAVAIVAGLYFGGKMLVRCLGRL